MLIRGWLASLALAALAACIPEPYEGTKDAPPARPTGVTVSAGDGAVTLSWNPASRAEGYNLYWDITAGVSRVSGTPISAVSSPYVHSGLSNGRSYYYVVTSWNANGESAESAQVGATPQAASTAPTPEPGSPQAPSAPTGFTATAGSGQVTLTWTAVSNATGYNTYWSTTTGVTRSTGTKIGSISSPYTHSGLTNGTAYHYVVTTLSAGGESAESVPVSATPKALTTSSCTAPGGCWATKAPMPTARYALSTAAVDDKLYAIGGSTNGITMFTTVEELDVLQNTWSSKAPLQEARSLLISETVNGKIYAIGGDNNNRVAVGTTEQYDPVSGNWTIKTSMPTPRMSHAASVVNGKIYVVGGLGATGLETNVLEIYDPAADAWSIKRSMPTARRWPSSCAVNGKIYVVGGWNVSLLSTVEEYDPTNDLWTVKAPMPTARYTHGCSVVNGRIYVIGGLVDPGAQYLSTVEEYDPASNVWTTVGPMPTARGYLRIGGAVTGRIYVVGGLNSSGPLSIVEAYTPPAP